MNKIGGSGSFFRLNDGSQSTITDDEIGQVQSELAQYKQKCRMLESENCALLKMIPQLKDAEGKDCTEEVFF